MQCSIYSNINENCKHGDIIYNDYKIYIVVDDGRHKFVLHTQTKSQSYNYVNIPLCVSKYIDDPYIFISHY